MNVRFFALGFVLIANLSCPLNSQNTKRPVDYQKQIDELTAKIANLEKSVDSLQNTIGIYKYVIDTKQQDKIRCCSIRHHMPFKDWILTADSSSSH